MRTKRKSASHIIDTEAIQIIKNTLPGYWSIRDYQPDYGIDLAIEIFEKVATKKGKAFDTLGEHIFIQVKGKEKVNISRFKTKERKNVEKSDIKGSVTVNEIDVIKLQIDTVELSTIERMGNAVIVMLFAVDVKNSDIYFLNLNDYVDKCIIPYDRRYFSKKSKSVVIPLKNKITRNAISLNPLLFYAKRLKYYAFFNKVSYQLNELNYVGDNSLIDQCKYFAEILLRFDIWDHSELWPLLDHYKQRLKRFVDIDHSKMFKDFEKNEKKVWWEPGYHPQDIFCTKSEMVYYMELRGLWEEMNKLYNVYEEICREWFIPTIISEL